MRTGIEQVKLRASMTISIVLLAGCSAANPPPPAADGAELFARHCASCHGVRGEGDGPVAAVMQVAVPNLRTLSQRNDGTFPADSVAQFIDGRDLPQSHGDRYMPVWGDAFVAAGEPASEAVVEQRIAALVEFLRQLQY
jgi:mono/diheme cytochrome c family protein